MITAIQEQEIMTGTEPTYEGIVEIVANWPAHRRFNLVQDVLKTLEFKLQPTRAPTSTLPQALGLLASEQVAPTDQEVAQWIDEHRTKKYG